MQACHVKCIGNTETVCDRKLPSVAFSVDSCWENTNAVSHNYMAVIGTLLNNNIYNLQENTLLYFTHAHWPYDTSVGTCN